jgi:hypothetical protein
MKALPPQIHAGFLESLANSIGSVFTWAILFAALVPILALFVEEIPLRGAGPETKPEGTGDEDPQVAEAKAELSA